MILEVCWDGLWTRLFGLSQLHGHGSWLMCEVALIASTNPPPFSPWKPSSRVHGEHWNGVAMARAINNGGKRREPRLALGGRIIGLSGFGKRII